MTAPNVAAVGRGLIGMLVLLGLAQAQPQFLTRFGSNPYDPLCAESCLRSMSGYMLACTPPMDHSGGGHGGVGTPPSCFAEDTAFLTSVAWCFHDKCTAGLDVRASKLEGFWERMVTSSGGAVRAKWTFSEALAEVDTRPPAYTLTAADLDLNQTSAVNPATYLAQWNVLGMIVETGTYESAYAIAIVIFSMALPIFLTFLGYLPVVGALFEKAKPYLIYPALIGSFSVRPLPFKLGNAPTVGQALYLFAFTVLNVVLTAVNYRSKQPNAWFATAWNEISAYVLYRTGAFAFAVLPILLLFSSRNNVLLWITNWSHPTFLLLHRWVGRLFMLYAIIHSIIGLQIYVRYYDTAWWAWGAVATVASVILALGSGLYVRQRHYELFLISHIVLSVFVVVGCWYHIIGWYASMGMYIPFTSGYEIWLYFAIAVWFFDRAVRVGRILKNGVRRAQVTELGGPYVRIDLPGVHWDPTPGKHAYVYFPTLDLKRPWENHPFSVVPLARLPRLTGQPFSENPASKEEGVVANLPIQGGDEENQKGVANGLAATASSSSSNVDRPIAASAGVSFLIKKENGITKHLRVYNSLLTLLDGPYHSNSHSAGNASLLACDRILLIAGGIGITAMLPWAHNGHWNVKLAWSVSEAAAPFLVPAVGNLDAGVVEKEVRVGSRFDFADLVAREVDAGWARVGIAVSGPGGLCDDVRAAVAAAGRRGKTVFVLEVDAYSW